MLQTTIRSVDSPDRRCIDNSNVLNSKLKRSISTNRFLSAVVRATRKLKVGVQTLNRGRQIRSYLDTHETTLLQLGSGSNELKDWLNTDLMPRGNRIIPLDATKPFPFPNDSFDHIFSEHQFQVLPFHHGRFMLEECNRILKPGGRVRIATLDLDTLVSLMNPCKTESQSEYIKWITDEFLPDIDEYRAVNVINHAFRAWGHLFIYDRPTLESVLTNAGFVNISQHSPGQSRVSVLQGIERHGIALENENMNDFETMVLEGTKITN